MIEKRFKTNEVGCIVDLKDPQLRNYDGEEIVDLLNAIAEENELLKNDIKMLSLKLNEVCTKYQFIRGFNDNINPNEAVKIVISELMQNTKKYR